MQFDVHVLLRYYPMLLDGLVMTVAAAALSLLAGAVLGLLLCGARMTKSKAVNYPARAYIDFFRATPEMVLIFWTYFCIPPIFDARPSAFASGVIALSLVTAAYMAEIYRAGIQSLPSGQFEAAKALGLPLFLRLRFVILPQAIRRMVPTFMTYLTELLKNTTLLSAIGVYELAYRANTLGAQTFRYFEFLTAVAVLFFAVIFPISMIARRSEVRRSRDAIR